MGLQRTDGKSLAVDGDFAKVLAKGWNAKLKPGG
jgi:hypothetical protein